MHSFKVELTLSAYEDLDRITDYLLERDECRFVKHVGQNRREEKQWVSYTVKDA